MAAVGLLNYFLFIDKMARRKYKSRRRPRRRRFRRKRRIMRPLFGQSRVVKHKWALASQFQISSSLAVTESFRLNSPWDPYVGTGTTSALGFTQLNALFQDCQVIAAKVMITYLPASTQHPTVYWCELNENTRFGQPSIGLGDIVNRKNTSYTYLATNAGSATRQRLIRKYSPKKYFYVKDLRDNETLKCIPANSLSAIDCHVNTAYSTTHAGTLTSPGVCDFLVQIDYIVLWTNPVLNVL